MRGCLMKIFFFEKISKISKLDPQNWIFAKSRPNFTQGKYVFLLVSNRSSFSSYLCIRITVYSHDNCSNYQTISKHTIRDF